MAKTDLQKKKPWRSKKYLAFIRTLPCCATGTPIDVVAHHNTTTGERGTSTKTHDYHTMPICAEQHALLHQNPKKWEDLYGTQDWHCHKARQAAAAAGFKLDHFKIWSEGLCDD